MDHQQLFDAYKEKRLHGRYITLGHTDPVLGDLRSSFEVAELGYSVQNRPVYGITAGQGSERVFIWSQMHGNESTTTKAVFDLLNFLKSDDNFAVALKGRFTFFILPMVNPDGAARYTRENANGVDLNRDAANLTQPESKILREAFENFRPHYCYNMHDQRSIFGLEGFRPATMSFLAPAYNEAREVNEVRKKAMAVICAMNRTLQQHIPGQVGRFDDSFNINCIGDMFQSLGVPTILFEAGHHPGDYDREITRKFVFFALLSGFSAIYENVIVVNETNEYFDIPQNKINFFDIVYRNVKINYENTEIITNFASQYKEVLFENSVIFQAFISEIGNLTDFRGHEDIDLNGAKFEDTEGNSIPEIGRKADFFAGNDRKFANGKEIS